MTNAVVIPCTKESSDTNWIPNPAGVIHELLHVVTEADDIALTNRVKALGITVYTLHGDVLSPPTDKNNANLQYSGYWGQALINHCGPNARDWGASHFDW